MSFKITKLKTSKDENFCGTGVESLEPGQSFEVIAAGMSYGFVTVLSDYSFVRIVCLPDGTSIIERIDNEEIAEPEKVWRSASYYPVDLEVKLSVKHHN